MKREVSLLYRTILFLLLFVSAIGTKSPNFVLVLTDDQDLVLNGLVLPMNNTLKLIANDGITFTNAFVNAPVCCPSRSTILTGKLPHNTHVSNNSIEGNCSSAQWQHYFEPFTIAARLKANGYHNFYAGKYLNQYGKSGGLRHVPQGYDWWLGLEGNSRYYDYKLSVNGTERSFTDEYLTDVLAAYALEFLNRKSTETVPFFMMVAPPAPHAPFTAAPRHREAFPEQRAVRNAAFNYTTFDKHWLVQIPPKILPNNVTILDTIQRHRLQTLLAVDELVTKLIAKMDEIGVLDNTYVIFTSDNGFHIGQFTQPWDKRQPYESDIRVPFLIRGPGIPKKLTSEFTISAVDIAPTILDLAGYAETDLDGTSFKNVLFEPSTNTGDRFVLIEYWGEGNPNSVDSVCPLDYRNGDMAECLPENWCKCQDSKNNTYACVRHSGFSVEFKYCKFSDGFVEAYDLLDDPNELRNVHKNMGLHWVTYYDAILESLIKCNGKSCRNPTIQQ